MSPSGMKQMSCESGLVATAKPALGGDLPHPVLGHAARAGTAPPASCSGGEHAEHVRLVLRRVHRPAQRAVGQPRVVPGDDRVEAERQRPVQHRRELDLLVAAQARVRRPAGRVLGHEVVDDVLGEALGEVPHVERDAQLVGDPAGVVGVLDAAAAAGAAAQRLPVRRQRQVHPGDVVPGVDREGGRDRGVHSPAHRGEDPHRGPCPARRARSTTGPITSRTASTSASVEVWPR